MSRVVVIGAGLAGLTAALRLAEGGASVTLVHNGIGGLQLGQGTVDILGYRPERVEKPLEELAEFTKIRKGHPYAKLGAKTVAEAVAYLAEKLGPELLVGDPTENVALPTAVGALRPTALYQPSMASGILKNGESYLFAGIKQLKDFSPQLAAQNVARLNDKVSTRFVRVDFPARGEEADCNALAYARTLDDPAGRKRFAAALSAVARDGEIIGVPAILGLDDVNAWREIAELTGHEIFEIPLAPPSVPGMRLDRKLNALVRAAGVRVIKGSKVIGANTVDGQVKSVYVGTAGRPTEIETSAVVLAVGGFESGSLWLDSYGKVSEKVFDLPLANVPEDPFHGDYWGDPQPLFEVGVDVDDQMRPVDHSGNVVYGNLYAAGGILAGGTRWQEKTGEGIALGSAVKAADSILGGVK